MVKLDLEQVVLRRMEEDDIEAVKALIKEGSEGAENRLILHILTRPLCLFLLAVCSSLLRCLIHSFVLSLAVPVFLPIVLLKLTVPRSAGLLGSSRPSWDYLGSSLRGGAQQTLHNPHSRGAAARSPAPKKVRRRLGSKERAEPAEAISPERERGAGQVWLADSEGEVIGCVFREAGSGAGPGAGRICRLVTSCWYRREGLGRLLVQGLEHREREAGRRRLYAHVPLPSKVGEAFFRRLGYRQVGEGPEEEDEEHPERPDRGFLGYPLTKVFYKDL